MNNKSCLFSLNTSMNGNFYEQTRPSKIEWEWMIFTVHKQEKMILWYPYFRNLMGNDQGGY
jgi:hypothetical protein